MSAGRLVKDARCRRAGPGARRHRAGAGSRQDRHDPADDRSVRVDRPADRGQCQALHGAARHDGGRQEDRADRQGRRGRPGQHEAHRAGTHRQRQGRVPGGLRLDAARAGDRAAGDRSEGADGGHGRRDVRHHREIAVHRAHRIHAAAGHRSASPIGRRRMASRRSSRW